MGLLVRFKERKEEAGEEMAVPKKAASSGEARVKWLPVMYSPVRDVG